MWTWGWRRAWSWTDCLEILRLIFSKWLCCGCPGQARLENNVLCFYILPYVKRNDECNVVRTVVPQVKQLRVWIRPSSGVFVSGGFFPQSKDKQVRWIRICECVFLSMILSSGECAETWVEDISPELTMVFFTVINTLACCESSGDFPARCLTWAHSDIVLKFDRATPVDIWVPTYSPSGEVLENVLASVFSVCVSSRLKQNVIQKCRAENQLSISLQLWCETIGFDILSHVFGVTRASRSVVSSTQDVCGKDGSWPGKVATFCQCDAWTWGNCWFSAALMWSDAAKVGSGEPWCVDECERTWESCDTHLCAAPFQRTLKYIVCIYFFF